MTGAIAVADYRNYESWRRARLAVCSVFDLTRSFSHHTEHKALFQEIDRLSVSILDNMAQGYEGHGHPEFIVKASSAIDRLDDELSLAHQMRLLTGPALRRLRKELDAVQQIVKGQSN